MRRVLSIVAVMLLGPMAASAAAHHPGDDEQLSRAVVERVIGEDAVQAPSGLYRVPLEDGSVVRTHGPDTAADQGALGVAGPRDAFLPGAAERSPVCSSDYAMQILYARPPSSQDRSGGVANQLRSIVRRSNFVLNSESLASGGGEADYKLVCSGGAIDIKSFTTTGTNFTDVTNSARAAGFTDRTRNYAIFLDTPATGYCGVGSLYNADSPGLSNPHNTNGGYSVIYDGCWEGTTFMHEVGHNRGAVQSAAPHSTGSGFHCNQGHDVMCYTGDGGDRNQTMFYSCSVTRFDCEFDDYFDAAPESGEWLASHWNLGTQGQNFLIVRPPDDGVDPDPTDVTPPTVSLRPSVGRKTTARKVNFALSGTDDETTAFDLRYECSIDGSGFVPCTTPATYSKLARGKHTFEARTIDLADNVSTEMATYAWKITRR